ncbi:MAG: 2-keto-3-deoxy-L-rhamnonate aldolase [Limimaricola sp.]|uniref:HpcH/HpaI aldolase family protein n=1 Tax=Limimaricola sp. TaxID=2211665 RepID=UPI001D907FF6|nr:HpcH/HpaI aldolase/citrate lyase family protein [Limimaricola sp.]MBI1418250.1 2-keto-3-deoxy-L-rhamnonate aldolase [Limimaricola sp.]
MPTNSLKTALAAGRLTRGVWLTLASPNVAEMAGLAGFDWCLIDGEHGPNTLTTIQAQLQALAGTPAQAVVRVPVAEAWIIKQVLDLGAQTVMVPMIQSGEGARDAVAAMRYPPQGIRGMGAALARASGYGGQAEYVARANDGVALIVQVESAAGIADIDAIATTEGVDCIFIGPADLAADMGHPDDPGHPEVRAAIDHALARIAAAGKPSGIIALAEGEAAHWSARGVAFIGVASDSLLLASALRRLAKA